MLPSLKAFLAGILDYAGLFPPAALPREIVLTNYARLRGQLMLGGLVLPVKGITALPEGDWPLVLLGSPVESPISARRLAESDAELVAGELGDRLGRDVTVRSVEIVGVPCPEQAEVYGQLGHEVPIFYETRELDRLGTAGLKIRTGGVTADRFPGLSELAARLSEWGKLEVPLKLTAGLHQPLPHDDPALGVRHHGFLNVFAAAMLARRDRLAPEPLAAILSLDRPEQFRFHADGLELPGHALATEELVALRRVVTGFGSCSFDEPMEALRTHGFLEDA